MTPTTAQPLPAQQRQSVIPLEESPCPVAQAQSFSLRSLPPRSGLRDTPASGDEAQVRSVVESYLHGLKFNDVESLRKAFWPDAKLYFVDKKGGLGQLSQTQWYAMFAGSAPAPDTSTISRWSGSMGPGRS